MSIARTLISFSACVIASIVFAQTTETKPPDVGVKGPTNRQLAVTSAPNPCGSRAKPLDQAEILTDTMGVDFRPYLTQITEIVRNNWYNLLPLSVYPPILKQGKLSIEFFILKNGQVSGMQVHTTSGDVALDRAAWASITASNPFPPLPQEFAGQRLGLRFYYFYDLESESDLRISPCADVRVLAGSTQQFSALGADSKHTAVTWSISGPGCSKSACGTISDTGLYTAPVDIPDPPTVIVEATLQTNPPMVVVKATSRINVSITAKSKVTDVQAISH